MKNFNPILLLLVCTINSNSQNNSLDTASSNGSKDKKITDSGLSDVMTYYYFPNMEAYFDHDKKLYHFQLNKKWMVSEELPQYYGGYSLFKNERVMITIPIGQEPEMYIKAHRKEFPYNAKGRIKRPITCMTSQNPTVSAD